MKPRPFKRLKQRPGDPLWFKDAVFYQMRIGSFADSDADGIGDFRGALSRIDYLHDLGVNTLWMLPFYPSPARDDGYDIADYMNIAPQYGTLADFRAFMDAARAREMHVITELVINHTSDQHAWFQRARRAPKGSPERDFYVWSDDNTRYSDVRIIFGDYEPSNWTWDPLAQQFYWHRFFHHQPDLNYDNPLVHEAVFQALEFWMDMGVDGVRLDAIPYLYEREGTNGESLPETHAFIRRMRAHIDARYPNQGKVLLAEANQWPEAMAEYYGAGDECNMVFHFPVMPRLYLAVREEERYPIVDILAQTPAIPDSCQWALFLRNHDELTLEMVTEEERETLRRAYAPDSPMRINLGIRRRLAPMFNGDRRALEIMNAMLFSLPGTPIVYYGDEIGMGDNVYLHDRNGVRTPMQWSPDRNAGFSTANPQRLALPPITDPQYHYAGINVELQQANPASLLWWMKRIMAVRRRYKAFGRGSIEFLHPANGRVLAFIRRYKDDQRDENILCVINLSRHPQSVALDLAAYDGVTPIELFGGSEFPTIATGAYPLTLGGHSFYWFELPPRVESASDDERPTLAVSGAWHGVFDPALRPQLTEALTAYLLRRPELARRVAAFDSAVYEDAVGLDRVGSLAIVRLKFTDDGDDALTLLPLTYAPAEAPSDGAAVIAEVVSADGRGLLLDATPLPALLESITGLISRGGALPGLRGTFAGLKVGEPSGEQTTALKLLRTLDPGTTPTLEIGRFLMGRQHGTVPLITPLIGALEYRPRGSGEPVTLAMLRGQMPERADLETALQGRLVRFYEERVAAGVPAPALEGDLLARAGHDAPAALVEVMGDMLALARRLGARTADLHAALASDADTKAFAPEPYGLNYQRSLYQSLFNLTTRVLRDVRAYHGGKVSAVDRLAAAEAKLLSRLKGIASRRLDGQRIRIHGAFHLGHVLRVGDDFLFTGFAGDLAQPLSERRLKRSPLRDVVTLIRAFDDAAFAPLTGTAVRPGDLPLLTGWAHVWRGAMASAFLNGYLPALDAAAPRLLPTAAADRRLLLERLLIEESLVLLDRAAESDPARVTRLIEILLGEIESDSDSA